MKDIRGRLSVSWVFATLNYIYADVFACFGALGSNNVRSMFFRFSPGAWLGIAILMEIPMAMILLSWILRPEANRWANIVAGVIETLAVLFTQFIGPIFNFTTTTSYYLFFGTMEVPCTLLIVWYAWRWPSDDAIPILTPSTN